MDATLPITTAPTTTTDVINYTEQLKTIIEQQTQIINQLSFLNNLFYYVVVITIVFVISCLIYKTIKFFY